jgi:hypothetical protein
MPRTSAFLLCLFTLVVQSAATAQNITNTIAGGGGLANGPATSVSLPFPSGIGGRTLHFNDFVVAYPATPSYAYTLSFVPPLSSTRTAHFEQGDAIIARFKLSPNTPAGIATQAPNHVGYSVLLDTNKTGCGDYSGTIEPTVTPTNSPADFTYDPEHQLYDLRLRGIYRAGQYKLLFSSNLAPEQCAVFAVTRDD